MNQRELVSKFISYSLLKSFDEHGPKALIQRMNPSSKGIDFGSKLDDFISLSKEQFNEKYIISQLKLDNAYTEFAEIIVEHKIDVSVIDDNVLKKLYNLSIENDLFKRITKEESRLQKINNKELFEYVNFLYSNEGKELITPSEYTTLLQCQMSLFTHKSTKKYFNFNKEGQEEIYQLKMIYPFSNSKLKLYLDKVNIDHNNKTIQGIDLKSGSVNTDNFMTNFFKFKYYFQGGIYQKGLEIYRDEKYPDYTLLPFKFIFLPTFNINNPKTFVLTDKWIDAAWNGFTTNSGYKYKGIIELVDEIEWHIKNQVFNESKEFYLNDEINLDDSFIHNK